MYYIVAHCATMVTGPSAQACRCGAGLPADRAGARRADPPALRADPVWPDLRLGDMRREAAIFALRFIQIRDHLPVRVASWNVAFRSKVAAECQGELLRALQVDVVMLQELNPASADTLRRAAGLDWLVRAVDLRVPQADDRPVRRRGVGIAGRGRLPRPSWILDGVRLPERTLAVAIDGETELTAVSYHAPPGVTWGIDKPRQAVALAQRLALCRGPVLVGADANTPELDAADFAATRTHWHSGKRILHGEPGDDLMFGPAKIHHLDDALRRWLADHPDQAAAMSAARPRGPLAITHYTGKRKNSPGCPRRFDAIWATPHWKINSVDHLYDAAVQAGSDHAVVLADLELVRS